MIGQLGWDAAWEAAARAATAADAAPADAADSSDALVPVRIAAEHRGAYHAIDREGGTAWVELRGRTFHRAGDKRELPTVGDWVLAQHWPQAVRGAGAAVVRALLPRRSFLVRRAAGIATAPQPLAANVDVGIVMTSANSDLSLRRLERYVSLLRDGGIEPVIAVSKLDLAPDPTPLLEAARAVAGRVVGVSIQSGAGLSGLDELRALGGPGKTAVLLGSSGVGKSSLLNALVGTSQETREIRADERGRHTTTRRELFLAPDGGMWIDTPGMRELAQWLDDGGDAEAETEAAFDDIAALSAGCRFRDCRHQGEPGCAVQGAVPAGRLAGFHKLADERRASSAKQEAARRLAETRRAKGRKPRIKPDDQG